MKQFSRLALAAAMAAICSAPALADPGEGGSTTDSSFTPPPPFGQGINELVNSLPSNGNSPIVVDYNFSGYTPPPGTPASDLQVSYSDIVGLTGGTYDQYFMTNTSAPPPPPKKGLSKFSFGGPPAGNPDDNTAGENYAFTVTKRTVAFTALVPEPAPLALMGAALVALALARRRRV